MLTVETIQNSYSSKSDREKVFDESREMLQKNQFPSRHQLFKGMKDNHRMVSLTNCKYVINYPKQVSLPPTSLSDEYDKLHIPDELASFSPRCLNEQR